MTKEEQIEHIRLFTDRMKGLLESKGNDYSNDDRLSVFKLTAVLCHTTPEKVVLDKIITKVMRLSNLLSKGQPNHESIDDTIIDLVNYAVLLDQIIKEK